MLIKLCNKPLRLVTKFDNRLRTYCLDKRSVNKIDIIGPPDSVSNLRPVIKYRTPDETLAQKRFADFQEFVQNWNQGFWARHNSNFTTQKKLFIEQRNLVNNPNSDEMSEFYKQFLDDTWKLHLSYNYQWYKHNAKLLVLSYIVLFEKVLQYFK